MEIALVTFGKLIGIIVLVAALYLLWLLRFVVLLGFTAVALATVLNRLVRRLTKMQVPRGWAIALTFLVILGAVAAIIAIAIPPFVSQVIQWLDQAPLEVAQISAWLTYINDRVPAEFSGQLQQLDALVQDLPRVASGLFGNVILFLRGAFGALVNLFFVLVVTVMLLANPKAYRNGFISLFPFFYRQRVHRILDLCETSLVGWGLGILFNMSVISVLSFAGLALLGIPLPIGNAFIAGVLTFVPNVGPILSVIPPIILGLLEAPWKAIAVLGLYFAIQQIESTFLTPMVMKHQVALLPAVALVSQLIFGILFGFLGLFLALPLVIVGQVLVKEILVNDIMDRWRLRPLLPKPKPAIAEHN